MSSYTRLLLPSDFDQSQQQLSTTEPQSDNFATSFRPTKLTRLKVLVFIITVCSVLIFLFGVTALGMSFSSRNMAVKLNIIRTGQKLTSDTFYPTPCCYDGSSIWGGIFLLITSGLGLASVFLPRYKCPRVAFLVMAIIATVFSAIICILHGIWASVISQSRYRQFSKFDREIGFGQWMIVGGWKIGCVVVLTALVCMLGFVNMVSLIVASSLWCCNWCRCCGGGEGCVDEPMQFTVGNSHPQGDAEAQITASIMTPQPESSSANQRQPNAPRDQAVHSADCGRGFD